jgi:hypothetical protein
MAANMMKYSFSSHFSRFNRSSQHYTRSTTVRLGNSGLQVSRFILECSPFGEKGYQPWLLEEPESLLHIKAAYGAGINTFDTANTLE